MSSTDRTPDADLAVVLHHWTHMRDLIDTATPEAWPPADTSRYLAALDEHDRDEVASYRMSPADWLARPGESDQGEPAAERERLVLAEAPAPLRLHVVDACRAVEVALAAMCDEIAAEVQRAPISPPRKAVAGDELALDLELLATRDTADPRRWRYNMGDRSATAAATWLRARLADEAGPFLPLHDGHRARIAEIAREAARRVERTIGSGRRSVPMDRLCPWCTGLLVMHRSPDDGRDAVTCETGRDCTAPVVLDDRGHRVWRGADALLALHDALDAADRRRRNRDRRREQRARARANAAA